MVAIDNITIFLIFIYDSGHTSVTKTLPDNRVFAGYLPSFIHQQALVPNPINKSETGPSLTAEHKDAECTPFVGDLIYNI